MEKFKYTAIDLNKQKYNGIFIAQDEKDLAVQLAKQNLYLISSERYTGKTPNAFFSLSVGAAVKLPELTAFCRQYSIMINSGMSILACIDSLRHQAFSSYFRNVLDLIYEDVKGGSMLSDALNKHKKVFPDFFRSMIKVGEVSGKLDMVFNSLADYYESDARIKKRISGALAYPIMLSVLMVGIVVLMLLYIVPTFRESLSSLEVPIEGITKIVYDVSDWMLANWKNVLIVIVALVAVAWLIGRTEKGKDFYDLLKLKLPLIRSVQIDLITARFARGFGLLLSSGMDIIEAMDAIVIVLGNRNVEKRFKEATDDVRHGMSMATAFSKHKLFPDILIQMVAVGEKTAAIDEVLNRSCNFFDSKVETTLTNVVGILQPVMLILMALIVVVLFIAIYAPMISIMTTLG